MKTLTLALLACGNLYAVDPQVALSMVPYGKISEHHGRDFLVRTRAGTKIGIEFKRNGEFRAAKGRNLNKGDELEPGEGLISLSSAAQVLVKEGLRPNGHWLLDYDEKLGWVYEFENRLISAKSGKIFNGSATLPGPQTATLD